VQYACNLRHAQLKEYIFKYWQFVLDLFLFLLYYGAANNSSFYLVCIIYWRNNRLCAGETYFVKMVSMIALLLYLQRQLIEFNSDFHVEQPLLFQYLRLHVIWSWLPRTLDSCTYRGLSQVCPMVLLRITTCTGARLCCHRKNTCDTTSVLKVRSYLSCCFFT